MSQQPISLKAKFAIFVAIVLWASAFVAIRAGLQEYSPGGLALLRYLIASLCLLPIYWRIPKSNKMSARDRCLLLLIGVVGIGFYNLTLNYGEVHVSSGIASFIISQSPLLSAIFAIFFLKEELNRYKLIGFLISILGIALITLGETAELKLNLSLLYILMAAFAGGLYSVLQKPFLLKYNAIEATAYVIWGGTLSLLFYFPELRHDVLHASWKATLIVIYLGVFPAALGYLAWSYALSEFSATRAVSFLYFTPFLATLIGWVWLDEVPIPLSFLGGMLAVVGIWFVNSKKTVPSKEVSS